MMLFLKRFWEPIAGGEITVTFRRWKAQQVLVGRRYRTAAGIIEVETVSTWEEKDITDKTPAGQVTSMPAASSPTSLSGQAFRSTGFSFKSSTNPTRGRNWPPGPTSLPTTSLRSPRDFNGSTGPHRMARGPGRFSR